MMYDKDKVFIYKGPAPKAVEYCGSESEGGSIIVGEIHLGEAARGRILKKCLCPPDLTEGELVTVGETKSGTPRLFRSDNTKKEPSGIITAIDTRNGYIRGARGTFKFINHLPGYNIATGQFAYGDAGRIGTAAHSLVSLPFGCIVEVNPTRGDSYWLHCTKSGIKKHLDTVFMDFI